MALGGGVRKGGYHSPARCNEGAPKRQKLVVEPRNTGKVKTRRKEGNPPITEGDATGY